MWNSSDSPMCACVFARLRPLFIFYVLVLFSLFFAICLHYTTYCAHKIRIGCYIYCYLYVSHIFLYYSSHPCTKWIEVENTRTICVHRTSTYVRSYVHNTHNSQWITTSEILIWCFCLFFNVLCILCAKQ